MTARFKWRCRYFGCDLAWKFTVKFFEVTVGYRVAYPNVEELARRAGASGPIREVCQRCHVIHWEQRLSDVLTASETPSPVQAPQPAPESRSADDTAPASGDRCKGWERFAAEITTFNTERREFIDSRRPCTGTLRRINGILLCDQFEDHWFGGPVCGNEWPANDWCHRGGGTHSMHRCALPAFDNGKRCVCACREVC